MTGMVRSRGVKRRRTRSELLDGVFFTFSAVASIWFGYLLIGQGARPGWELSLLVVFWIFAAYLLLPRLHRILTRLYVPGYFIGRARTSDGLLGDPINLALRGEEAQVHEALTCAGWIRADDLDLRSSRQMVLATLTRRSYPAAPVSPLHLFDRQQDFAYQQEVGGSTSQRHHARFWRTPEGWMLPGGYDVDWLAAGTFDKSVGLSLFTWQVTHKIEQNTDLERDFVVDTVVGAGTGAHVSLIENFSTGYHSRNGGGDAIMTDGHLPVLDVSEVVAPPATSAPPTDSRDRLPAPTAFGGGVSVVRGLVYVVVAAWTLLDPRSVTDLTGLSRHQSEVVVAIIFLLAALFDVGLGTATLRGRNWARLAQMGMCTGSALTAFFANWDGSQNVTVATLPPIGLSILVLLALSSHASRDYATRDRREDYTSDDPSGARSSTRV